jgi:DNA repair protein RadA/Sms
MVISQKQKTYFVCQQCGHESAKWLGKCPECSSWSTFQEEVRQVSQMKSKAHIKMTKPTPLLDAISERQSRISTGIVEFDGTLGGGVVPGAVVLIGGDPGIGKSTLMLQILDQMSAIENMLYVSGEESINQVHMRAKRLSLSNKQVLFSNETNIHLLLQQFDAIKPSAVAIDSVQTIYDENISSIPGNISQLRACTAELMRYAKRANVPMFLVGHVTKEGSLAGPKVLEHMVDTVLYFEGDSTYDFRILRSVKNRFGPVNEIGLFQMTGQGLLGNKNPSEIFLSRSNNNKSGNAIVAVMEGNRSFLVQVQSLVTKTQFGNPQRTASGIDHRRMNLLLAVLEKRCAKPFGFQDVFIKVAGGLRIDEPAADLGICMALVSSLDEKPLALNTVYIGEVGLDGEIRPVNRLEARVSEANKLGFSKIVIPKIKGSKINLVTDNLDQVSSLHDLV